MEAEDVLQKLTSEMKNTLSRMTLSETDILRQLTGDVFIKKVFREEKPIINKVHEGPAKMEVIAEDGQSLFALAVREANSRTSAEGTALSSNMDLDQLVKFFNTNKPDTAKNGRRELLKVIRQRKQKIVERKRAKEIEQEANGQFESENGLVSYGLKQIDFAPKKPHHQQTYMKAARQEPCNVYDRTIKQQQPIDSK